MHGRTTRAGLISPCPLFRIQSHTWNWLKAVFSCPATGLGSFPYPAGLGVGNAAPPAPPSSPWAAGSSGGGSGIQNNSEASSLRIADLAFSTLPERRSSASYRNSARRRERSRLDAAGTSVVVAADAALAEVAPDSDRDDDAAAASRR